MMIDHADLSDNKIANDKMAADLEPASTVAEGSQEAQEGTTKRGLKSRHIQLIALGWYYSDLKTASSSANAHRTRRHHWDWPLRRFWTSPRHDRTGYDEST